MRVPSLLVVALTLVWGAAAQAADLNAPVSLETRWWSAPEFGWRLGEALGVRWAMVEGISGRARVGGENTPAATVAADFQAQTGIRAELIAGVLVLHRPDGQQRKPLEALLPQGGAPAVRAAWQLGGLKDAGAWRALAQAAADKDTAVALAAAQALRRLDGEEPFDLRRWLVRDWTPHGHTAPEEDLWQVPLGLCCRDPISPEQLKQLSGSPWVPLREAAARIAPGCGDAGKAVAEALLARDPSLLVRQAAQRSLRAWQGPEEGFKPITRPPAKPDLAAHWKEYSTRGDAGARTSGPWLAAFGAAEDIQRLVETFSTTKDEHVRYSTLKAITYNSGGTAAEELFRQLAVQGKPWPDTNHGRLLSMGKYGLAMLLDGEKLADEIGPLLGTENWALSSEFLLARFAGPAAVPHLKKVLASRGHVAPLAVGFIGGPEAIELLAPLLESEDLSTAIAAAGGLGESGQMAAVPPLIQALQSPNRVLRSRAALALGRIGGPEAAAALASLVEREQQYLPRRSACQMLKEIGSGSKQHAALAAAVEKELDKLVPAYDPVNGRFGPDFPEGKMVRVGKVYSVASIGETRFALDAHSGILLRYGGCSGCYSNECIGFDPASEKWFVVRPPENMRLFFNETRAAQGCSRGMAYDARSRQFWINHAVGGNGIPANSWMYPSKRCCKYDLATDRFEGSLRDFRPSNGEGEGPTWYIADCIRGRIFHEWMGPTTLYLDTATGQLCETQLDGAPNLPENYNHDPVAFDPVSGLILRSVSPLNKYQNKPETWGLWLLDQARGTARKSKAGLPEGRYGGGNCLIYDSLNRELILFLSSGAWRYDREQDRWQKVAEGDCSVYVVDYDPQHNVFLASVGWGELWAFRYKNVPVGTKAHFGQ